MVNLHNLIMQRFVNEMLSKVPGWKILVLDEYSTRVISSVLKMTDLTQYNVSVVEKLSLSRKPMKEMDAIYFISPIQASIDKLVSDFQPQQRLYNRAHVFLTSTLPTVIFDNKIRDNPCLKYFATLCEINIEFVVAESQLFFTSFQPKDYKGPSSFYKLFSPRGGALRDSELQVIARQISTMCASLGDYPLVRYDDQGVAAKQLAQAVQNSLDELNRLDEEAFTQNDGPRPTLLILDRSVDIIAPFLHEFTYQAMVQDLLKIEDNRFSYKTNNMAGQEVPKTVTLDDEDPMWINLRHKHIAEAIEIVTREFQEFTANNKAAAASTVKDGEKPKSIKAASDLVRALPQYQTLLGKFSLHFNMQQEVMKRFKEGKLEKVAEVEQDMACKQTVDGDPVTAPEDRIKELLKDTSIAGGDRARLVMQYIAFHGPLSREDRQQLGLEQVGFSQADIQAFSNLNYLTANKEVLTNFDKGKKKKSKDIQEDVPYHLSRYVPAIKKIADDLTQNALDPDKYPFVKPPPEEDDSTQAKRGQSARTTKANPTWAEKNSVAMSDKSTKNPSVRLGGRFLIFVAGGITYSELRTIYQITNKEIILGSTNVWKPMEFVENLRELNIEK